MTSVSIANVNSNETTVFSKIGKFMNFSNLCLDILNLFISSTVEIKIGFFLLPMRCWLELFKIMRKSWWTFWWPWLLKVMLLTLTVVTSSEYISEDLNFTEDLLAVKPSSYFFSSFCLSLCFELWLWFLLHKTFALVLFFII